MKMVLFALLALAVSGCTVVGPGELGVRISLGKVSTEPKAPGMYLWVPGLFGMAKIDTQVQKSNIEAGAASKDMQEITTEVAVNWSMDPTKVVDVYSKVGDEDVVLRRIIVPAVNEIMKSAISKRTAEEVLTKRLELKKDIDDGLKDRMVQYGVTLHDVSIVNFHFSPEFTQAIEQKQIAEQKAKQAEYDAVKASKEADAEVNRAKGQAEAQRLLRQNITPELLQMKAVEKWDGKFPQVTGGGALPFINLKMESGK
jgi:prohibitin 1